MYRPVAYYDVQQVVAPMVAERYATACFGHFRAVRPRWESEFDFHHGVSFLLVFYSNRSHKMRRFEHGYGTDSQTDVAITCNFVMSVGHTLIDIRL